MKVRFRNNFFAPDGNRYRKMQVYDVPDSWSDILPKSATVLPDGPVDEPAPPVGRVNKAARLAAAAKGIAPRKEESTEVEL